MTTSHLKKRPPVAAMIVMVVAGLVTTVIVLATASHSSNEPTFTGEGAYYLSASHLSESGVCMADDSHAGIVDAGSGVTVIDSHGTTVAQGQLEPGVWQAAKKMCKWRFSVPNVPAGRGDYRIRVGAGPESDPISEKTLRSVAIIQDDQLWP